MKSKRFDKKLFLAKKTIADLSDEELKHAHGGTRPPACESGVTCYGPTCPTETGTPQSDPCCQTC